MIQFELTHAYTHKHTRVTCTCSHTCIHTHCIHICNLTYMYMSAHTLHSYHMHWCTYTYTNTHIHTHVHAHNMIHMLTCMHGIQAHLQACTQDTYTYTYYNIHAHHKPHRFYLSQHWNLGEEQREMRASVKWGLVILPRSQGS